MEQVMLVEREKNWSFVPGKAAATGIPLPMP